MAGLLESFIEDAKRIYGGKLRSIILYGSRADGEDIRDHSDYNLLVILDTVTAEDIKALSPVIAGWIKRGNQPPLIFTSDYFRRSADVFPIEFLDMKEKHKVLYGEDLLKDLAVERLNLRHECEFELKSKLLKLRQAYMVAAGKPKQVQELLIGSVSSFLVLFRSVIRLMGKEPPAKKLDSLHVLAGSTGINTSAFVTVMEMKQGNKEVYKQDPEQLMKEYLSGIEKIVTLVDDLTA